MNSEKSIQDEIQESLKNPIEYAYTLPEKFYISDKIYLKELDVFFYNSWLCVGRAEQIHEPGDFFTKKIGDESIIIIRNKENNLQAFYNVCRHRGSRILLQEDGKRSCLKCPYHGWEYGLDGSLINAPNMEDTPDFNMKNYNLVSIKLDIWENFIFINMGNNTQSLLEYLSDIPDRVKQYRMVDLRLGIRKIYNINANWKLLEENFLECYHCPEIHPHLVNVIYSQNQQNPEMNPKGPWIGGWMDFYKGVTSVSQSGNRVAPPIKDLPKEDLHRGTYFSIFPNLWLSLHPDHVMVHTVWPEGLKKTKIICEWYFEKSALDSENFDSSDVVNFDDQVNLQDWNICEIVQQNLGSKGYRRGRFSVHERSVPAWDRYYLKKLSQGLNPKV